MFIHNKHHFDSTVVLYRFRYLGNRHTSAVLTFFLSGCIIFIEREHRFYSTVGSWFTRVVLAFFVRLISIAFIQKNIASTWLSSLYQFIFVGRQNTKAGSVFSVRFCYFCLYKEHRFYSTVVFLYQFRYVRSRNSQAALAFWSVSDTFIYNKHWSVVLPYQFRHLKSWYTGQVFKLFVPFYYFHSERALLPLDCPPSLPV